MTIRAGSSAVERRPYKGALCQDSSVNAAPDDAARACAGCEPAPARAYACTWTGLPDLTVHYRARSRSRARMLAARTLAECNYGTIGELLPRVRVVRAPDEDDSPILYGRDEGQVDKVLVRESATPAAALVRT